MNRRQEKEATLPEANADIAAMSFEDALKELEQIVEKLEKGTVGLEESIAIYARGEGLKTRCNELLKNAEQRIEKITLGADGRPVGTEPLDAE
jgi:exodeoxyribonuclease VII small subunit